MREVQKEISKALYDQYRNMTYVVRNEILKEKMPIDWLFGYGYYGHRLMEYADKYYIIYKLGETCD